MPESAAIKAKKSDAFAGARLVDEAPAEALAELIGGAEPKVFRGLVADWPAVAAARRSPAELVRYLAALDCGATVRAFVGDAQGAGRFFYNSDLSGFNFKIVEARFKSLLDRLLEIARTGASEFIYMGSTDTREIAPGFASQNPLEAVEERGADPRLWIGTSSRVAPHYDESDNVACVVSGRRRFILFPTDQIANPLPH